MTISLYDMSVVVYQQILASTSAVLSKGKAHAEANRIGLDALLETRLTEDMLPLRFQIISTAHHSLGAIEGIKAGVFGPPAMYPDLDFDGLHGLIGAAQDGLTKVSADEVNALLG